MDKNKTDNENIYFKKKELNDNEYKNNDINNNTNNDIEINVKTKSLEELEVNKLKFQKMCFLYNALDSGWSIKKRDESYIFTKNHGNKKEILDESYLTMFIKDNIDINGLLI